jgi:uncharacterized protein (UPF0261 family)
MTKSIAIIATLDTKGEEVAYLKHLIEELGYQTITIDIGVLGEPPFEATIGRHQVVQAGGRTLEEIIVFNHEAKAMGVMAEGASKIVKQLYSGGKLSGVLAVGGSVGTSVALKVMKVLPLGIPKLIVSTIAFSHAVTPDEVNADLMMMQWAAGLWGLNSISRMVFEQAAGAISGAAEAYQKKKVTKKKLVGLTSLGSSQLRYVHWLKPALEERGYEVAVFHATGMGGRGFEQAIAEGTIDVALDLALSELINEVCGGVGSAGEHRLEAAGRRGIPQIVAVAPATFFWWATGSPLPSKLKKRPRHRHNGLTVVAASKQEMAKAGRLIAEKLNMATVPAVVVIPLKRGVMEANGKVHASPFNDPEGGEALFRVFKRNIKPETKVIEIDAHINDKAFADKVLALFDEITKVRGKQ